MTDTIVNTSARPSFRLLSREVISGLSFSHDEFVVYKTNEVMDPQIFLRIASNLEVGMIVKGYLDHDCCLKIMENFSKSSAVTDRTDNVPAHKIGADQYGKTTDEYLQEVESTGIEVDRLFRNTQHVGERLREDIRRRCLRKGMVLRRAIYEGRKAGDMRGVKWRGHGTYVLDHHEDASQITDPKQGGFEIQDVITPVALNGYPYISSSGGQLRVYNVQPDEVSRKQLGLMHSGYPYPESLLDKFEYIDIGLESGDLLVLNGRFVHAVLGGSGDDAKERLLLNAFVGILRKDPATMVWWT
jgi:hypothetical protein